MPILEAGTTLGSWTVSDVLGTGGNGEVWRAAHHDGRQGALKVIRNQKADKVPLARFRREIGILDRLGPREGVVPLLDSHVPELPSGKNRVWYVMGLAAPLRPALASAPVVEIVNANASLARTLASLHATEGLAHRDIKPENLYLWDGKPAIGDFGLVSLPDVETVGETGRIPGSFGYIADELMVDPSADGQPADVFALAKVLWVLLTGYPFPFQGALDANDGPASLTRFLTHPRASELDVALAAATARVPERLDMAAFADDLGAWCASAATSSQVSPFEAALERAKRAMSSTRARQDSRTARTSAAGQAIDQVRAAAAPLLDRLVDLDPSAVVGPDAIGEMHYWLESPEVDGAPLADSTIHWGLRLHRTNGWPRTLIVAFCVQVHENGELHVGALVWNGPDGVDLNPVMCERRTAHVGSLLARRNVEAVVSAVSEALPGALEDFSSEQ